MDRYKTTFQTWNRVASAYQDKFMDLDLYNDTYDLFCGLTEKPTTQILEIGCGPGNITRHLLTQRPDYRIEAIDVAPNMVKLAQENNPTAQVHLMDCREIDRLTTRFDAVMCGFCLPYLSKEDAAKLIHGCSLLMNNGGIMYLSTIEGAYHQSGYESDSSGQHKTYVYYYEENYLTALLEEAHFECLHLIRKRYPKSDGSTQIHLIFMARKK